MKDRFITLVSGLFALYIVIALLAPPSEPDYASYPLSIDRDQHGLALLYEWLGKNNIPLHALRQRYDDISSLAKMPDVGNLIFISLPLKIEARQEEIASLRQWIAQGNTALLLVAHSDAPEWAPKNRNTLIYSNYPLLSALGFDISIDVDEEEDSEEDEKETDDAKSLYDAIKSSQPIETTLVPAAINNSLLKSVKVMQQPRQDTKWVLSPRETSRGSRILFSEIDNKASGALWQTRIGDGTVIISRYADLFSNNWLAKGDNARLFDTLLQQHRSDNGFVLFDDMHQGLTELYDPDAFYSDPRVHNTLWFLFSFWLLYLIGHSNRLAPPSTSPVKVHAADFIRAMGGLFARRLSNATAALGLIRAFFNEIRLQYGLPANGQPVWEILDNAPRIQQQQVIALQTHYKNAQENKKQNLVTLQNQLRETRKSLL